MVRRGKKGAIELSMTTIIIIIIGVTLLSLSLIWIRGTIKNVTDISEKAFKTAEGEIGKLSGVSQLLTLSPTSIDLAQQASNSVEVIIANFETQPISVTAEVESGDPKLICLFADRPEKSGKSKTYNLGSGSQVKIKLIVSDTGSNLGVNHCVITAKGTGIDESTETLIMNIIPKRGVFG